MALLVDGYNVLFTLGFTSRQASREELEAARRALLDLLADKLGTQAGSATVVFDAPRAPRTVIRHYVYRGITVRLSARRQAADDLIEEQIALCRSPRQLTVVSNDQRLIKAAKLRGAKFLKTDELLAWLDRQCSTPSSDPAVDADTRPAITAEQTSQWLKEFGHLDHDSSLNKPSPFEEEMLSDPE